MSKTEKSRFAKAHNPKPEEETLSPETVFASYLETESGGKEYHRLPLLDPERYPEVGHFGRGGMGEVRRVYDRMLGREVAMKVMHSKYAGRSSMMARFIEEAQATAQLQHPSIVPVYDLGRLEDGRLWFTMKEVKGQTFTEVIQEVHQQSGTAWEVTAHGWHLRKLVSVFAQVCEAVAYAHERGVMHRDLKPQNIMLGERGEVWVVDWGLVKVLGLSEPLVEREPAQSSLTTSGEDISSPSSTRTEVSVVTDRSLNDSQSTMVGTVSGTPAYMSPEQASGAVALDVRSDIYSLGTILYELLCGSAPYAFERHREDLLSLVRSGPPLEVEEALIQERLKRAEVASEVSELELRSNLSIPHELIRVCQYAMQRDRAERYQSVHELLMDLSPWLEGTKRRTQALELLHESEEVSAEIERLSARAQRLRVQAQEQLQALELWVGEEQKAPVWAIEDEAEALEREVLGQRARREALLQSALQHSSDLLEARLALARIYRASHELAELNHEPALNLELSLNETLSHIPDQHPSKVDHLKYLRGEGALTLITDPPGAEVLLYRYEPYQRRLVPKFQRSLGVTPLIETPLEPGSYLCKIQGPSRVEVLYPVFIERGQHWDGVPPEGGAPTPIYLPRHGELREDECYIPAGWFWSGGDTQSPKPLVKRRLWCDALVYQRYPVTNRDFMDFLHTLVERGDEELALRYAPREDGTSAELTTMIYHYEAGRFSLKQEEKWAKWQPDWPVYAVDWFGANAYADWLSQKTSVTWRLPGDLEWEKIARGVDARPYPWGEFFDPSWACMRDSHPEGAASPASVYDFPYDQSVYGVRGVSGNARFWCMDAWSTDGPPLETARVPEPTIGGSDEGMYRALRCGSWYNSSTFLRACYRFDAIDTLRFRLLGFRMARRFTPTR